MTAPPSDFRWCDATELSSRIRRREISAQEVVEDAIARIEAENPQLNAVVAEGFDQARAGLEGDPRAPYYGVPMLVKDLGASVEGMLYSAGNRALREVKYRSKSDTAWVRKLREAGFALLGRTNSPEFGTLPTTEPLAWGPTRNPYALDHSPGGSSGGSAASVAAGFAPVAHASDGGGSIRVPASACGLVGLKPSRGRISLAPDAGEAWAGCATDGVVTRSVRDTAALLDVMSGPVAGDPYTAPLPDRSFAAAIVTPPPRLRIALAWETPRPDLQPEPVCVAAVDTVGKLLVDLGHEVELCRPDAWDRTSVHHAFTQIVYASVAREVTHLGSALGRPVVEQDLEPMNWVIAQRGREVSAETYLESLEELQSFTRNYAGFFAGQEGFDILVTPTMAIAPPRLGEITASDDDPLRGFRRCVPMIAYTSPLNISGLPAVSLPLSQSDSGLPIGAQFVAAYGEEALLLRLAAELEAAEPWRDRHPEHSSS